MQELEAAVAETQTDMELFRAASHLPSRIFEQWSSPEGLGILTEGIEQAVPRL